MAPPADLLKEWCRERTDSTVACGEVVSDILDVVLEIVQNTVLDEAVYAYTANAVTEEILTLLDIAFPKRDEGERDLVYKAWTPDIEPDGCEIDSWGRCFVDVRTKQEPQPQESRVLSPVASKRLLKGYATRSEASPEPSPSPLDVKKPVQSKSSPSPIPKPSQSLSKEFNRTEPEPAVEVKEDYQARQQRLLVAARVTKDYQLDEIGGRVIPLRSVDVNHLPELSRAIRSDVEEERLKRELDAALLLQQAEKKKARKPPAKRAPRAKAQPTSFSEHWRESPNEGPMIEREDIFINPGVALLDVTGRSEGGTLPLQANRLQRSRYQQFTKVIDQIQEDSVEITIEEDTKPSPEVFNIEPVVDKRMSIVEHAGLRRASEAPNKAHSKKPSASKYEVSDGQSTRIPSPIGHPDRQNQVFGHRSKLPRERWVCRSGEKHLPPPVYPSMRRDGTTVNKNSSAAFQSSESILKYSADSLNKSVTVFSTKLADHYFADDSAESVVRHQKRV